MLKDDINILTEQVERLVIENNLLRAASEEQRELNGNLRTELNFRLLMKKALEEWVGCFEEPVDINWDSPRLIETYNLTIDLLTKLEE